MNKQSALRQFLDRDPYGFPLDKLGLEYNDEYTQMEAKLSNLMKNPKANASAIHALQE